MKMIKLNLEAKNNIKKSLLFGKQEEYQETDFKNQQRFINGCDKNESEHSIEMLIHNMDWPTKLLL